MREGEGGVWLASRAEGGAARGGGGGASVGSA